MEDCATTFFINGLKVHIESSINKYEENLGVIYDQDFDNLFLNPIFINNLSLFRDLIYQNNLNFQIFWNHIGKMMNSSIESIILKFEEEIKKEKEDDTNLNKEIGNKNILKLKILNLSFFLITNEESFELIKEDDKQKLKNLLEIYINEEIEKESDFTLFIKNYIIKISLLINNKNSGINISFLKFLSFTFYNFGTSFKNNEHMNQLKIYIDQAINNPRRELNNYLNAAYNKKSFKKERICRSRGASFDIKDPNGNINMEKNNKKIYDFFKSNKKEKNENSSGTKGTENKENENKENLVVNNIDNNHLKKQISKINNSSTQGKYFHYSSHASNLSLFNFNSGISNISNSYGLNNSFSFSKNISNSRLSLDDSFSLTGIFSTPISDLNDNDNDNKKFTSKFPTIIKCVETKRNKPFDKYFNTQMNIKNYMKIDNKKKENDELKELKKIINSSFYGNENDYNMKNNKKNKDKNGNKNLKKKEKDKIENKNKVNKGKNKDILIYKTPNKNEKTKQGNETKNENIKENMNINGLKKNWELLFAQKPGI